MEFGQNTGVHSLSLLQGIFLTRDQTQVSGTAGGFFTKSGKEFSCKAGDRASILGWEDPLEK